MTYNGAAFHHSPSRRTPHRSSSSKRLPTIPHRPHQTSSIHCLPTISNHARCGSTRWIGIIPGQSVEEFNKELSDYAKAATIFKPITGAMAGRFTGAAVVENAPRTIEGLYTPSVESENARVIAEASSQAATSEVEGEKRKEEEESPKAHAARMGMYGRMTREVKPWQPARLLCKRFGVKDPDPEVSVDTQTTVPSPSAATAEAGSTDTEMIPTFTGTESFRASSGAGLSGRLGAAVVGDQPGRKDISNIGLGEDESQGRDTLTYEKPSMDIFKAIFASDDEDSSWEGDGDGEENEEDEQMKVDDGVDKLTGSSTGTSSTAPPPAPLKVGSSASPMYNPSGPSNGKPIDVASFKPTFIPRDHKKTKDDNVKDKESKKDKKKKKSGQRTIVSFEMDEDGGESLSLSIPKEKSGDRPMKKKRKEKERDREKKEKGREGVIDGEDDESMWVEKPPPEAIKNVRLGEAPPRSISAADGMDMDMDMDGGKSMQSDRGRKKAVDFW